MFPEEITKEDVDKLPLIKFPGRTHVISTSESIARTLKRIESEPFVGFDTETKPNFKKGTFNKLALVQIATEKEAYLIRVQQTGITNELRHFFSSSLPKLGIALHDDIKALQKLRSFTPGGFVSINTITVDLGIKNQGIRKLSAIILGHRISKRQQLSNWENKRLTPSQISYAATDAWICWKMYSDLLKNGLVSI